MQSNSYLNLEGHCSSSDDWSDKKFHKRIEILEDDFKQMKHELDRILKQINKYLEKESEDGSATEPDA